MLEYTMNNITNNLHNRIMIIESCPSTHEFNDMIIPTHMQYYVVNYSSYSNYAIATNILISHEQIQALRLVVPN